MRKDAEHLLEKLGRQDFRYQEFVDPFAELELWPIFEALITDERVVGGRSGLQAPKVQLRSAAAPHSPESIARIRPDSGFARYRNLHDVASPSAENTVNVRKFFNRLSDDS